MAKLEDVARVSGQQSEKSLQQGLIPGHVGRKLIEQGAKLLTQNPCPRQEVVQSLLHIPQLLEMRDETAYFDRINEAWGSPVVPACEGLFRGKVVKGVVEFHRGEVLAVEFQPLGLSQFLRIE